MRKQIQGAVLAGLMVAGATTGWATNGMDLEGYGAVALGMGGASMAYDNGTAGMANNPATLSLMPEGTTRMDLALGFLGPKVEASMAGMPTAHSSADAYFMPAFGLVTRKGDWTYGIGVFGQGGMGTTYSDSSFLALNSGAEVSSEVSVARVVAPLSYQVTDALSIGGTLDLIWGGMDVRMAMPASQGMALLSGMPTLPLPQLGESDYMRFDFADDSQFSGSAKGVGVDMKVGALYTLTQKLRIGATYHAQPELGNLEAEDASLSFGSMATGEEAGRVTGKVKVNDFRWPAMAGIGAAYDVCDNLMVVFDIRHILWSDVMQSLSLDFTADGGAGSVSMVLPQNWEDQTVYMIGVEYSPIDSLALRAGYNYGKNPVPDSLVNPLFPAIPEQHFTLGAGYTLVEAHLFNAAMSIVPENTVHTPQGMTISHGQISAQLMYSYLF
jgi:long-chain fatty acid transport protein